MGRSEPAINVIADGDEERFVPLPRICSGSSSARPFHVICESLLCASQDGNEDNKPMFTVDHWQFSEVLGTGAQSTVYLVTSTRYAGTFAGKVIVHPGAHPENYPEWRAMWKLCHPSILQCYDGFIDGGQLFLIYERCHGGSLADLIDSQPSGLSYPRFQEIASQLVQALSFIHANGFAHGDIKPANILFCDAAQRRAKLADFGMSRPGSDRIRITGGTPAYVSPEIHLRQRVDPRAADVWALGVCFCMMAQGQSPWTGHTNRDKLQQIVDGEYSLKCRWPDIAGLIKRMLVREEFRVSMSELAAMPFFSPRRATGPPIRRRSESPAPCAHTHVTLHRPVIGRDSYVTRRCPAALKGVGTRSIGAIALIRPADGSMVAGAAQADASGPSPPGSSIRV